MILDVFSFSYMTNDEILNLIITLFFFCFPCIMAHFFDYLEDKIKKGNNEATTKDACKRCKIKDTCPRCDKKAKDSRKC